MITSTRKNPTLTEFKRWLAKQPARREFYFMDNDHCLLASFVTETDKDGNRWTCPGYNEVTCGAHSLRVPNIINVVAVKLQIHFTVSQFRKAFKAATI